MKKNPFHDAEMVALPETWEEEPEVEAQTKRVRSFIGTAIAFVFLLLCMVALANSAKAAECGKHEKVVKFLDSKYKEKRQGMGLVSNRGVMEFMVSKETGTWTVLLTNTQGISCIVAAGESYQEIKPTAKVGPDA